MATRRPRRKKQRVKDDYKPPFDAKILNEPVTNLTFRNENTLQLLESAGIKTIGDVLKRQEKDFYRIFTFKKRNLLDVKGAIKKRRLYLKPTPSDAEQQQKNNNNDNTNNKQNDRGKKNTNKSLDKKQRQQKKKVNNDLPQDKYIKINKGGKWGFSDRQNNKIVVQPQYDEVFIYKEDLCCVEKDELFGFIDREGEEVIPIIYECALSFSEGFACVYKNGNCGYINKTNDIVIDFKYDAGTSVENGECRVKKDGKWGELRLDDINNIRWI